MLWSSVFCCFFRLSADSWCASLSFGKCCCCGSISSVPSSCCPLLFGFYVRFTNDFDKTQNRLFSLSLSSLEPNRIQNRLTGGQRLETLARPNVISELLVYTLYIYIFICINFAVRRRPNTHRKINTKINEGNSIANVKIEMKKFNG